jgi:hypothetical protein
VDHRCNLFNRRRKGTNLRPLSYKEAQTLSTFGALLRLIYFAINEQRSANDRDQHHSPD